MFAPDGRCDQCLEVFDVCTSQQIVRVCALLSKEKIGLIVVVDKVVVDVVVVGAALCRRDACSLLLGSF